MFFIVISTAFAEAAEGQQEGPNVFHSTTTSDGRHVVAHAALVEFPALFLNRSLKVVELTPADFPVPAGLPE